MYIPSHEGLEGNELVDERALHAALNLVDKPLPVDIQGLARSILLREWQGKWAAADAGRFAHSILPKVSLRPCFEGHRQDRKFVSIVMRIMSGHCAAQSLLSRFRILEVGLCVCLKDYEKVDCSSSKLHIKPLSFQSFAVFYHVVT
jgi:hypothetical protein